MHVLVSKSLQKSWQGKTCTQNQAENNNKFYNVTKKRVIKNIMSTVIQNIGDEFQQTELAVNI